MEAGDKEYTFCPSHIPYDSIRELTDGLGNLFSGRSPVKVRWNDEPVVHEFIFDKTENELDFRVLLINETLFGKDREEVFSISGNLYEVIRPFWVALRDLESRYSLDEYQHRWRSPFPVREMQHFIKTFRDLKKSFMK